MLVFLMLMYKESNNRPSCDNPTSLGHIEIIKPGIHVIFKRRQLSLRTCICRVIYNKMSMVELYANEELGHTKTV